MSKRPSTPSREDLGRRERQILDVLFERGASSAAEIQRALPDPPTYSAVRGMLRHLEGKGLVAHGQEGLRYIYRAVPARSAVRRSALEKIIRTFFGGSRVRAVAALMDLDDDRLTEGDLDRIAGQIRRPQRGMR